MSLLVRNGKVLKGQGNALERADILIIGDRISEIGLNLKPPAGTKVIDATGHLILPGLINAHTHAHNNLMRGTADNWTLEDLLNHGGALNANRTPEDHYLFLHGVIGIRAGCQSIMELRTMADVKAAPTAEPILKELYAELSAQGEVLGLPAGALLWKEGDPGDCVALRLDGLLEILHDAGDGEEVVLRTVEPVAVVGEIAADGQGRSAAVRARTRSRILKVSAARFKSGRNRVVFG